MWPSLSGWRRANCGLLPPDVNARIATTASHVPTGIVLTLFLVLRATEERPALHSREVSPAASNAPVFIRPGSQLFGITGQQQPAAERARGVFDRAVADFLSGRIAESVSGFDTAARLVPDSSPLFWQRGIALYYAGRYKDCRAQFEAH